MGKCPSRQNIKDFLLTCLVLALLQIKEEDGKSDIMEETVGRGKGRITRRGRRKDEEKGGREGGRGEVEGEK